MAARARWMLPEPDLRAGQYYCTAIDGPQVAYLSGPYVWHHEALADLQRVKDLALDKYTNACWAAYSTAHVEGPDVPRVKFGR